VEEMSVGMASVAEGKARIVVENSRQKNM
jgi:hypothetical protein